MLKYAYFSNATYTGGRFLEMYAYLTNVTIDQEEEQLILATTEYTYTGASKISYLSGMHYTYTIYIHNLTRSSGKDGLKGRETK